MSSTTFPLSEHPLLPFGWRESVDAAFQEIAADGLLPGRVARVDGLACDVVTALPGELTARHLRAQPRPVHDLDPVLRPCTGDWVGLDPGGGPQPVITAALPRTTAIVRASSSRRSEGQVLAANVDVVLITVSLAAKPDEGRIERFLALAWESGARPVVVLTKADVGYRAERVAGIEATAPGASVVVVSAHTGEGLDAVAQTLDGGTAALIGQSGTGKSTLVNALAGEPVAVVAPTRQRDEKGRHTTTARELIPIPGGVLIDTPGLRGVALFGSEEGVAQTFADIEALALECRFSDCAHVSEPDCAVNAAVADGAITARRLASYRKLIRENERIAARTDARLAAQRRREWQARVREARPPRP